MDNQPNNQNNVQPEKPNTGKNLVFALLFLGLIIVLFYSLSAFSKTNITLLTFKKDLAENKIESVYYNTGEIVINYKDETTKYAGTKLQTQIENAVEEHNNTSSFYVDEGALDQAQTSFFDIIYPILIFGGALLLIVFITKQIGKANGKSFDFVKTHARVAGSKVKFADVAGAEEEKHEVKEIVEFLKAPQRFTEMGARIPKGVLLIGPPGTGKTLLAKAIAGEADVPFFTISGSDFMELFVGVGASRVRDLFDQAKKSKPCIIFIDEIDAIGRQRGTGLGGGNDEREQTLNQLLVQMDGFETNEGIIVIAATNRADILDPALMRPGRFDRQVYISLPDVKGREEILKVHSKNKKFASDVDFRNIARIISGFTGAEIENLLNEAAIAAARENQSVITMKDITEAIDKVSMGPQKKSRVVTERDKKITAYHEAGHAVIGKLVQNSEPVHEVSIIPRGGAAGYTVSRPDTDDNHITKSKLYDIITMLLGGRLSEKLFLKDVSTGASNDLQRATTIARKMVVEFGMSDELGLMQLSSENSYFFGKDYVERVTYSDAYANIVDNEIKKILATCEQEAEKILKANKKKLEVMVEVLLAKETIYSDEIDMILAGKKASDVIASIDKKNDIVEKEKKAVKKVVKKSAPSQIVQSGILKKDEHDEQASNEQPQSIEENKPKTIKAQKEHIEVLSSDEISESFDAALKSSTKKTTKSKGKTGKSNDKK